MLIYDSLLRVPLIFSWPDRLPQGTVEHGVVRVVDMMPTLLELLGWEIPREVSGESFLSALHGQSIPPRQSYGESWYPYENFGWSKLFCLIEPRWKYIRA